MSEAAKTMALLASVIGRECPPAMQADLLNAFLGCEDNSTLSDDEAEAGAEFFQHLVDQVGPEIVAMAQEGGGSGPDPLGWRTMESAPRDGRKILCVNDAGTINVCYPKRFPRPVSMIEDVNNIESKPGDRWEYFRDELNAPGHSWSMIPSFWMPLPVAPPDLVEADLRAGKFNL